MPDGFTPAVTPRIGISVLRRPPRHPYVGGNFRVFIRDREIGIHSISPLALENPNPLDRTPQTVVLRRAVSTDRTLWAWRAAIVAGKDDARDVTIVQLTHPDGKAINIWRLRSAVPLRWSGPGLDAQSDCIAFEEIEVTYDTILWPSRV